MTDKFLDATNLNCPQPIMKTKRVLKRIEVGDTLEVKATDPNSGQDFTAFAIATGHTLLHQSQDAAGVFTFILRRES